MRARVALVLLILGHAVPALLGGDPRGTFAPQVTYGAGNEPRSVAVGDVDGDLDLNLAVANGLSNDVSVLLNQGQPNFVQLNLFRADDEPHWPGFEFEADVSVTIPGVPGATSVTVICTGGFSAQLETGDFIFWVQNEGFADLQSMKSLMHGDWTVTISGASPSTSTFSFNADAMLDSDFFATTTNVCPANGSSDVPSGVIFSWNDPTGPETADGLGVLVESAMGEQSDNSFSGTLEITDTSWDPPLDLDVGSNDFYVIYANFDTKGLVSPLTVTFGSIVWSNPPYAPDDYPAGTPVLILGSQTVVRFDVVLPQPCPWDCEDIPDKDVGINDFLALLGQWGLFWTSCDFDGCGVGITDFLALLGAWGDCSK